MSGPTTRESDKFMLRLPEGMRDQIKASAAMNGRSMNAEIVVALEVWLNIGAPPLPPLGDMQPPPDLVSTSDILVIVDQAVRDALDKFQAGLRKE